MSKINAERFEDQISITNRNSQSDAIPDHYDLELKSGEKVHLQRVDSELNRDAIVFTAELAALAGLNTVIYHKYTTPGGALYVYSDYFEEGKTWFSGEGLTDSYVIEEVRRQFSAKDPAKGEETFRQYCQMIILDLFTLNCDRTHNNWRQNGNDILVFDYNFTFGSAELLHGLSNAQLSVLSSTGIGDYPKGKNRFSTRSMRETKGWSCGTWRIIPFIKALPTPPIPEQQPTPRASVCWAVSTD